MDWFRRLFRSKTKQQIQSLKYELEYLERGLGERVSVLEAYVYLYRSLLSEYEFLTLEYPKWIKLIGDIQAAREEGMREKRTQAIKDGFVFGIVFNSKDELWFKRK